MAKMGLMRLLGHIRLIRLIGLIWPIGLIGLMGLLAACSQETETEVEAERPFEVKGYVTEFGGNKANMVNAVTRAWAVPSGYTLYGSGDQTIGICFTQNGKDPMIGRFFKSSDSWRTNLTEITNGTYYLYGYIPHARGASCSITDLSGDVDGTYSDGAILTLSNVPAVLSSDFCVVIGAKDGTDEDHVTGLRSGDFSFTAKPTSGDDVGSNYVFLLLDHLYASIRVSMQVHPEYDKLRTISLKRLQLATEADGTPSKQKTNVTVTLTPTDGSNPSESPINSIVFEPTGEDMVGGLEFWSSPGEVLTTTYSSYIGFFMPEDVTTLILTSTYDIFDKQGNLVRENSTATNTIPLSELLPGQVETRRSTRYTINLTIRPTYLYMMSDPDADNPVAVME